MADPKRGGPETGTQLVSGRVVNVLAGGEGGLVAPRWGCLEGMAVRFPRPLAWAGLGRAFGPLGAKSRRSMLGHLGAMQAWSRVMGGNLVVCFQHHKKLELILWS